MTKDEVISYIKQKKDIEHEISGIYTHKKYSWVEPSGLNVFTCVFFENVRGKQNNFVVSSGAGDHSRKCAIGRRRQKTYKLEKLTPELLDKIVDEVIPEFYNSVELSIKTYKEKQKLKSMKDDF
jgi:hypothetical protein